MTVQEEQYKLCTSSNYFVGNIVQIVCALIWTILAPLKQVAKTVLCVCFSEEGYELYSFWLFNVGLIKIYVIAPTLIASAN